jgi:ribose-phosphate pyrophosphokinase
VAIFLAMPGNEELADQLAALTSGEAGELEVRRFPDGESYVWVRSSVKGRRTFVVCTLARPDLQFLALLFAASELRNLGAERIELIAPYLAYMRQDARFHEGEALTSAIFARLISLHFDALITVDPHLHRHASLDELYSIPSTVVRVGPLIGEWIAANIERPAILGPDAESEQWVEAMAQTARAPWAVLRKARKGDRQVELHAPDLREFGGREIVIVDDIVSSGATMLQAIELVRENGFGPPQCIVIHLLADTATTAKISNESASLFASDTTENGYQLFQVGPLIAKALAGTTADAL